ncbi:MAG: hypothetical protein AB9866_22885 [Syntrophobacteraceae bacterium]
MKSEVYSEIDLARQSINWRTLQTVCTALFLIGAAAFLYGLFSGDARRAWSAYLTNYVYWAGLTFGTFLLSPILVATNATWGRPIKRLSESVVLFMPILFLLLWPLFLARETVFWWVLQPDHHKAPWLNSPFFFAREGLGLLAMTLVALLFTYRSVRSDLDFKKGSPGADTHFRVQSKLSPTYIILYAFILTAVSFDFIMSLDKHWVSTLFGPYYFMVAFYSGLAFLAILATLSVKYMGMGKVIGKKQFHDLGKLLFAFCVVCADFFYVQFLVIWYGNLPEETRYVITRVVLDPWAALAWFVLLALFALPFLILVFRKIKTTPAILALVAVWILIAAWLEKFLLVTPSLVRSPSLPLGPMEVLITLGWLGLFSLCVCVFLQRFPILVISDPALERALEKHGQAHPA